MNTDESLALNFDYENKHYEGEAVLASSKKSTETNPAFDIFLGDEYNGTIVETDGHWATDNHLDSGLLTVIGSVILGALMSAQLLQ
ncbi:MAG: hypothetical protein ABJB05_10590 [Parafilimonas sp.]